MQIHNLPSNIILRNALQKILQKSFPDSVRERRHLYLVRSISDVGLLDTTLKRLFSVEEKVIVNTLSVAVGIELRKRQIWLRNHGIDIVSDYCNPTNNHKDKHVSFYSSEDCRPFLTHVYKEIVASLSALTARYHASIVPIGSDTLPDFPCKLDVDILICIPNKEEHALFCYELTQGNVFIVPPQNVGALHSFFYAELLGTPIDLHVCNGSLEYCPLFTHAQQLKHNPEIREQYKQLKIENEGKTVGEYRKAKTAFRQKMGWNIS